MRSDRGERCRRRIAGGFVCEMEPAAAVCLVIACGAVGPVARAPTPPCRMSQWQPRSCARAGRHGCQDAALVSVRKLGHMIGASQQKKMEKATWTTAQVAQECFCCCSALAARLMLLVETDPTKLSRACLCCSSGGAVQQGGGSTTALAHSARARERHTPHPLGATCKLLQQTQPLQKGAATCHAQHRRRESLHAAGRVVLTKAEAKAV